jgi:hypothetical protein
MPPPNCSELKGFFNEFNTCWNIVAQTILFYNMNTRTEIFEKLIIDGFRYEERARTLVRNAKENIKFLLPDYFGPEHYDKVENDIIYMFTRLIERINIKYKQGDGSAPLNPMLRREVSKMSEYEFTGSFLNIFELNQYPDSILTEEQPKRKKSDEDYEEELREKAARKTPYKDYTDTGKIYDTFFIFNLLSVVLLNNNGNPRLFYFTEQNMKTPLIEDNSLGSIIWVPNHVVGIFKCDTNDYKYVDNNFITSFNFKKLIKTQNKINCSFARGNLRRNYRLNYHPRDGISISIPGRRPYFFSPKNPDLLHREEQSQFLNIHNIYEYTGTLQNFKQFNESIKKMYSPNYRLFIDIQNNNIQRVRYIYKNFSLMIDDDYIDEMEYTIFKKALLNGRLEIAKIIIENMKTYDSAVWYINELYDGNPIFLQLLELILRKSKKEGSNITNIDDLITNPPVHNPDIKKMLLGYGSGQYTFGLGKPKSNALGSVTYSSSNKRGDYQKKYIMYANAKSIEPSLEKDFKNLYLKYIGNEAPNLDDIFYKKYIMYKQKYLNLKNKKI